MGTHRTQGDMDKGRNCQSCTSSRPLSSRYTYWWSTEESKHSVIWLVFTFQNSSTARRFWSGARTRKPMGYSPDDCCEWCQRAHCASNSQTYTFTVTGSVLSCREVVCSSTESGEHHSQSFAGINSSKNTSAEGSYSVTLDWTMGPCASHRRAWNLLCLITTCCSICETTTFLEDDCHV